MTYKQGNICYTQRELNS
uniref:Uncharacterized protein n=1 Tax=Rhizophora mucronata TaxID=61149 RepID=A0A2P2QDK6_RHIMU